MRSLALATFAITIFTTFSMAAETVEYRKLTLKEAVIRAQAHAPVLAQAKASAESAEAEASSAQSGLYPKLTLDGSYRMQSVVPEASVGSQTLKLTDDHAYSVGPTLSYILWDSGLSRNRIKSLEFLSNAKNAQKKLSEAQVKLATQIAYVQASMTKENALSADKAESLVRVQNKDIQARKRSGSASQLDALTSDSEILNYQLRSKQARMELESSLADLAYYLGERPTTQTEFESLAFLVSNGTRSLVPDRSSTHPAVQVQMELQQAADASLRAQKSQYWPTISLAARSSLDYPNGPKFEQIHQNLIQANLTWNLFDFGGSSDAARSKAALSEAARASKEETSNALIRDLEKTRIKMDSIKAQINDAEVLVKKHTKLAQANFASYRYGSLRFSDVQMANLRLLEAENRLTALRGQYLIQDFTLQYLSGESAHE